MGSDPGEVDGKMTGERFKMYFRECGVVRRNECDAPSTERYTFDMFRPDHATLVRPFTSFGRSRNAVNTAVE